MGGKGSGGWPGSADHLIGKGRPWQKGQSGNPKGGPKKKDSWAGIIAEVMDEVATELAGSKDPSRRTVRMVIVRKMALKAMKGEIKAAQWLSDRESGKPSQSVDLDATGLNLGPVILPVKESDAKGPEPDSDD